MLSSQLPRKEGGRGGELRYQKVCGGEKMAEGIIVGESV